MSLRISGLLLTAGPRTLVSDLDLEAAPGEACAVTGPSGSGKTTLLNACAGLRRPDAGSIDVAGTDIWGLDERRRRQWRLSTVGLVFQFIELLPELTVVDNVALPARLAGTPGATAREDAERWLQRLGLDDRAADRVDDLSGGEQQRVGIARAFARSPAVVIADEPTGMLDLDASREVVEALRTAGEETGCIVVLATHDPEVARAMDAVHVLDQHAGASGGSDPDVPGRE